MTKTQFGMVSEWMANGSINEFVKAHPNADRFGLVGLPFYASTVIASLITAQSSSWEMSRGG